MDVLENIVSGVVGAISATAILTLFAMFWRKRVIRKYGLTQQSKQVLAALWDEGLIRLPAQIAKELAVEEETVKKALETLKKEGLVRIRKKDNETFWKITLKGKEYLSQLSWLGEII